jgi:hypothetical protein
VLPPLLCVWELCCWTAFVFPEVLDAVEVLLCCAAPPLETFVGAWVEVAAAFDCCSVGALWVTVCDWPLPAAPPV